MEEATDPQAKVELAKQLAKLLPRPRQARRPRRAEATPSTTKKKNFSIRDLYPNSSSDDGNLVLNYLVSVIEGRVKTGELKTKAERDAYVAEVLASLPDNEREACEALNAEGA